MIIRILVALCVPFITTLIFVGIASKKYVLIDDDLRYSASSRSFPHDISNCTRFMHILFAGKLSLYYPLTIVSYGLLFFFPKIGTIAIQISSFVFLILCYFHWRLLSKCKRAMRGLDSQMFLLYTPLRFIYRLSFVFAIVLLTYYHLTFDFVFAFI